VASANVIDALASVFGALKLPTRLRDLDVPQDALPELARVSFDDWYLQNNPRPVRDAEQLQQILQEVW
jgi:alcohol dehydrogenase class IV